MRGNSKEFEEFETWRGNRIGGKGKSSDREESRD